MSMSSSSGFKDVHPELKRKWAQIFHFCKGGRDGDLTIAEIKTMQESFVSNEKIPLKKRHQCATVFEDLWRSILGDKQFVTCEQLIDANVKIMATQAGTMALALMKHFTRMFYCVDFNDDGKIDLDEFMLFMEAIGFKDGGAVERAFRAINTSGDGFISLDEYLDAYMKYEMDANVTLEDLPLFGLQPGSE